MAPRNIKVYWTSIQESFKEGSTGAIPNSMKLYGIMPGIVKPKDYCYRCSGMWFGMLMAE